MIRRIANPAYYDTLTRLPNRTLFNELLKLRLAEAEAGHRLLAVMLLDLDGFKEINDSFGHPAGDKLLQKFSARVKNLLRHTDILARWAGDEFTIALPEVRDLRDIAGVAERIIGGLEKPFIIDGNELYLGVSIGISVFPKDGMDVDTLVKNADISMYGAKQEGKGRFVFFDSQKLGTPARQLKIRSLLKKAVEKNELIPFYQSQVDIRTGRIIGFEVLLRWNNAALGPVPPGQFIPIAEESGLILPIGRWLLKTVCAQNMAWQKMGIGPYVTSVNISARQILDGDLAGVIAEVLEETGLAPRYLALEITENVAFGDLEQAVNALKKIKELGVKIYLDDFGVGFSTLSCLTKLPVDYIKIDKSFLEDLANDDGSKAVLKAIIDLAHNLNLQVIAEGVEKAEQLVFLKQKNCDAVQGFLYSKPLPAKAIENYLSRERGSG